MSKTGGGPGTNQYKVRGVGKQKVRHRAAPPRPAEGDGSLDYAPDPSEWVPDSTNRQGPIHNYVVYVAHPIDLSGGAQGNYLQRVQAAAEKQNLPWVLLDPQAVATICSSVTQMDDAINHMNAAQQAAAQGVLAFISTDVPSVGTPIEIAAAHARSQPCAVVTSGHSWVLAGMESASNGRLKVFDDLDQAAKWLQETMGDATDDSARA